MATTQQSPNSSSGPSFDEHRWVINIRETLMEELEQRNIAVPVSVFSVPKPLFVCKPEAYTPHLFAIGPYHHWNPQLYEMERYKLATAKRTYKKLLTLTLDQFVQSLSTTHEYVIRCHYHRYLDFTGETLAWLMAIDASFLLQFLRCYAEMDGELHRRAPSMSHMVDSAKIRQSYDVILKDIVMLENQIPLFLVRELLLQQSSSPEVTDEELTKMLLGFVMELSPFELLENSNSVNIASNHAHLLALLYGMIVPKSSCQDSTASDYAQDEKVDKEEKEPPEADIKNPSYVKRLFLSAWSTVPEGTSATIKRVLITRPIKVLVKLPWKVISSIPVISVLKKPIQSLFSSQDEGKAKDDNMVFIQKPPMVEEIAIPSVSELIGSGIKIASSNGDLSTISFDTKTHTFYLPTVSLDSNTEVVLWNLIAYEATVESGPLYFTRYTELMNGIIDTEEDVKLLRERGIVFNRLKSDTKVANLWNGMSSSLRLTKVPSIDKVIEEVNKYYNSRWSVKTKKFMKDYILASWQLLAFVGAVLLLLMTCLQAFCSVYNCSARWFNILNSSTGGK